MSKLIDPVVDLDFYPISSQGSRLSDEAKAFSGFLKMYLANWQALPAFDEVVPGIRY